MTLPRYLERLESEAIHIIREGFATSINPVVLFSAGKDSTVLAHLVISAFFPAPPPIPLLHVDSTWEFRELLAFRDRFAERHGFSLTVYANEQGRREGINPFDHGDTYTTLMRTEALKQALTEGGHDVIFGGARRDEEATRAKERIVSVRNALHGWDPKHQRPEMWSCYNFMRSRGQTLRVYPLSNWTEHDLWTYIVLRGIELAGLYLAAPRLVVMRDNKPIVVDDPDRMRWKPGEEPELRKVRFRTLGCWPVTAAVDSDAITMAQVYADTVAARTSERQGRISDSGSLEQQKRDGYF
jgi:sulfate adenylyltransferase subunit 2